MLNRDCLKVTSKPLSSHVSKGFAVIDVVKEKLCRHHKIRSGAEKVLRLHVHDDEISLCDKHYVHDDEISLCGKHYVHDDEISLCGKHYEWRLAPVNR